MLHIVTDENIPYAEQLFSPLGKITMLPGRDICPTQLKNTDVLLVRSVTQVNEELLSESNIKFVGTSTIGTDHLDLEYLGSREISWTSAPGCNANAVVQYVLSALVSLGKLDAALRVAIVGCGNVGGRLYRTLKGLGFQCSCIDPFIGQDHPDIEPWDAIYEADIVCVHTPLTYDGDFPTHHLFDAKAFSQLKKGCTLLNAGRGSVFNNDALLQYLQRHNDLQLVLDVWENEPSINSELYRKISIGTPHIAGYSYEGRVNGSLMVFRSLAKFLGMDIEEMTAIESSVREKAYGKPEVLLADTIGEAIQHSYNVRKDHQKLALALSGLPASFDILRKQYRKRREFSHYIISGLSEENPHVRNQFEQLGFPSDGE